MTPLDQLCTTAQRIRDRADERDMAHRELKGAAEAIERMEQDVEVEGGGDSPIRGHRSACLEKLVRPETASCPSGSSRPAFLLSALPFWSVAGLVFAATWLAAVLLEEPASKPTPPYYKTFQERLGQ